MQQILVLIVLSVFVLATQAYRVTLLSAPSRHLLQRSEIHHRKECSIWSSEKDDVEEAVKKYGLEAGLLKSATDKESKVKPKDLLAKYGIAYLATSITLAIISYGLCYALISNGVDVAALLEKVGIKSTQMAASTGTAALAYAVHKAASPIRFPPTVALTPVVAGWLGSKTEEERGSK